ncbi:MAG: S8/S53 family peptidase [Kofleriaceae bacterium]
MSGALDLVNLRELMALTSGSPAVRVALIDSGFGRPATSDHARFIAALQTATTASICPQCSLLTYGTSTTTAASLAGSIDDAVLRSARVINLACPKITCNEIEAKMLRAALDFAAQRGVVVIGGANAATVITQHPWVVTVATCDLEGTPATVIERPTFGRDLMAPGIEVESFDEGGVQHANGASVAMPFVTGAVALLCSAHPNASGFAIREALLHVHAGRKPTTPPLLDAWQAYTFLRSTR